MTSSFTGRFNRSVVAPAVELLAPLVTAPEVAAAWTHESVLPGFTVGGLTRHLVSQPVCAVEFLVVPPPSDAQTVSLQEYAALLDWLDAPVDAPENTSIRDDFTGMAAGGADESITLLDRAQSALGPAVEAAGPVTYVPWQDCCLATHDFLVVRLLEIVVHADDLAASVGLPPPSYDDAVTGPVLELLAVLAARRHGPAAVVRALSRAERAGPVSAFGPAARDA